ncbi:MAG: flagellar biosynthetic protein FliR [Desulfovibrionaceae bacterium]|nr:flagellar biosynthetic protein FliR [Desulfovibrionaceae bacterium]
MDIFHFDPAATLSFFLTLFRISVVLFLLPFFGGRTLPAPVKAAMLLVLSFAVWPRLSFPAEMMPASGWNIGLMLLGEVVLGLVMGMMVNFLFAAVQTGGQIIGFQMGFAMINVVDPLTGLSEAVTAHFLYMCTTLVFLAINGHLFLLQGLAQSFEYIPPGKLFLSPQLANNILDFSKIMFTLAIKIAAPVMAALFIVDLALALISRAAPQMHVLMLGFPVKIAVGFFFLAFIFNVLSDYVAGYVKGLDPLFLNLFKSVSG